MRTTKSLFFIVFLVGFFFSACQPVSPATPTAGFENIHPPTQTPSPVPTATPVPLTATPTQSPYLQVAPESLKGIHVRFWHPWSGETALQLVILVDEFNRTNSWGIFVEAREIGSSGQLFQSLQTEWQDPQTRPHLIVASIDQLLALQEFESTPAEIQSEPLVVDLNNYIGLADFGLTLDEILDFPLVFWEQDEVNGYRLGIPIQRSGEVIFYNQTWAAELGFSASPITPEEFKAQACAAGRANANNPDLSSRGTGGWIISTEPLTILSWMFAFGSDRMPDDPSGVYKLNTPAIVDAFTFLKDLFNQDCAWISRLPDPQLYFANRQALFYSGSLIDIPLQTRVMANAGSTDTWTILPYPHEDELPVLVVSGSSLAILQSSPQEQMAAWLFIHWILDPERLARLDSASGSFPVRISSLDYMDAFRQQHPQWGQAFSWLPWAQPAPRQPSWRIARWVISDAAYNAINPNILPTPIPFILEQAETAIPEILGQP